MDKLVRLWKDRQNQKNYIKWLIQYVKPYTWKICLMMFISLFSTVISLISVEISRAIIDRATAGSKFIYLVALYLIIILGMQFLSVAVGLFSTMLNERFSFGIRKQVYEKILRSHWMQVKAFHTGDLMTRLTSDAGSIADGIIHTIPGIIVLIIQLVIVFFYLASYSLGLALFSLVIAPIAGIVAWWIGHKLKALQKKVKESEAAYRSFLQESLANLLIVKAFTNEPYSIDKLVELREQRFFWVFKKTKMGQVSSVVMSLSFQLAYIVAFTYGALQISRGEITFGAMTVFLTLVNRVQSPIISLAQQIPKIVAILASAERVMELEDIPTEEVLPDTLTGKRIGVTLNHVNFGYTDEIVIKDASLTINPGEFMAIMGESGIGKTTLIRLIMSFVDCTAGNITFFDENNVTVPANATARSFISYVPQGNTLFSGTIRDNLLMGNHYATDEELWEALRLASGEEFVSELAEGLDTKIGERGHGLSEGQAQRIAIARAFIRKAPFLILDEATSALDEATEAKVIDGLRQLEPKPTCLIITHRRSIIKYCDRELKIENGKLQ